MREAEHAPVFVCVHMSQRAFKAQRCHAVASAQTARGLWARGQWSTSIHKAQPRQLSSAGHAAICHAALQTNTDITTLRAARYSRFAERKTTHLPESSMSGRLALPIICSRSVTG